MDKYGAHSINNGVIGGILSGKDGAGLVTLDERIENTPGIHEKFLDKLSTQIGGDNCYLKSFADGTAHTIFTNLPPNELLGELWDAKLITHDEMLEAHKGLELSIKTNAPAKSGFLGLF